MFRFVEIEKVKNTANVFPEPVFAIETISLPLSAIGHDID